MKNLIVCNQFSSLRGISVSHLGIKMQKQVWHMELALKIYCKYKNDAMMITNEKLSCDRILENLPCWHKTCFRTKQSNFSEFFFQYQFLWHILIKQLLSFLSVKFETYHSFLLEDMVVFIPPGRCAQRHMCT